MMDVRSIVYDVGIEQGMEGLEELDAVLCQLRVEVE